jgi:hypothetical protein
MLTKKFVSLIQRADAGILDLNQAADMLQVRPSARRSPGVSHLGPLETNFQPRA